LTDSGFGRGTDVTRAPSTASRDRYAVDVDRGADRVQDEVEAPASSSNVSGLLVA